jgi:tetratricopeptide (TPR) repeat protein
LIAAYPERLAAWNLRGMVYFAKNDFENALRDFKRVLKPGPEFTAGLLNAGAVFVTTGYYDKADAFLASVPQDSEFVMPAFFWRLKSAVMRGDGSLASRYSEKLLPIMGRNELREGMEHLRRSAIYRDKTLLPALDAGLLKAAEEQAQKFYEFPRGRGNKPMTEPLLTRRVDLAPASTLP